LTENKNSKLYVIPTPIGNMGDITVRALDVLKRCDLLLAEDTRTTGKLLKHFEIETPMRSYHIHNEHKIVEMLVQQIREHSQTIGLVSDAGTPGISDPGFLLIRECLSNEVAVECLPGPTALIPALVNSGFPTDRFLFEGFLPHKKGRQTRLQEIALEQRTIILYESPHRLLKALSQLKEHLGPERQISVSRELTKVYEEVFTDTIAEVEKHYQLKQAIKGEIVIVIAPPGF
jgi:16S rRNA (cytidine1402-2'-O)-methyltransferase